MNKKDYPYYCSDCSYKVLKWLGQCPDCGAWGTVIEHEYSNEITFISDNSFVEAKSIVEYSLDDVKRYSCGIAEFDRVLGGGIVSGSVILLSGEPGIGKSTLLLSTAYEYSVRGKKVLYISAEESTAQIRLRAERIKALNSNLFLAAENNLTNIMYHLEQQKPELVILDSIQTIFSSKVDSLSGSMNQIRIVANTITDWSKSNDVPSILVGHINKDGDIAGPKNLEHLVDVVCYFDGERNSNLRFLRSYKNRFGANDEIGCFQITESGVEGISDPSKFFVSENDYLSSGTCLTVSMQGKRPLTVEIQALVAPSSYPNAKRVANGVSFNRLAMIIAVLERKLGLSLASKDIYISTIGAIKVLEPSADIAIALAIVSAFSDKSFQEKIVAIGEITLTGGLRSVINQKNRISEAQRLGYERIISNESYTINDALKFAWQLKVA